MEVGLEHVLTLLLVSQFGSADGSGTGARFNAPFGIATDGVGNVYVADRDNHTIRKITPAGAVSTLAGVAGTVGFADGSGTVARFDSPYGIAADSAGNVYVTDVGNQTIRKITSAGIVSTLAGAAGSSGSVDGSGVAARFNNSLAVATDRQGNLYIADTGNHTLRKITSTGVVSTLAGATGTSGSVDGNVATARFKLPHGVAADNEGNVYVADTGNHSIRKITSAGVVTTLAGVAGSNGSADGSGATARFYLPQGIATDSVGNVYVADTGNHTIRKITPAGVVTTVVGVPGQNGFSGETSVGTIYAPTGLAVSGTTLYFSSGNAIFKVVNAP